jgi:hypothetical protein
MAGQATQVEETGALQRKGTERERERARPSAASGAVVNTGPRGEAKQQQQQKRFFQESTKEKDRTHPHNPQN